MTTGGRVALWIRGLVPGVAPLASVLLATAVVCAAAPALRAQERKPQPARNPTSPPPAQQQGLPADNSRLTRFTPQDTMTGNRRDTTAVRARIMDWAEDDSVMVALKARAGYTVVRYQAHTVGFAASGRTMTLLAKDSSKAAVERDSTMLVADSIAYSDSLKRISATGDTIVMRDPAQASDVIGHKEFLYDVERKEGKTRDFSTVANAGEDWLVSAQRAAFVTDTANSKHVIYGRDGRITSCLDSVPHYHFEVKELKRVSDSWITARPAVVYVQDVPVMWLPFMFQDIREGRRSGMLPPRVGFAELVRNSPTYRRTVENIGYYFAINDYVDAQMSLDWRSSARATEADPGWTALNGEVRYRWLDRFMSGSVAVQQRSLSSGSRNTGISWSHAQEFSARTRFNANLNYVTSTQILRQTAFNPSAAVATIASQLNLVRQQGPFTINLGGTQRQYPGRQQIDRTFPSLNVSSKPLAIGETFVMNPTFSYSTSANLKQDQTGDFAYRYFDTGGGVLDSTRVRRNSSNTAISLGTPFKIFDFQVQTGFRFNNQIRDYPQIITVRDPADTSARIDRVYASTYESSFDFDVSVGLPQFLQGTWNLSPSVSIGNVDSRGFAVRTHLSNGQWVNQSKRLSYALGITPTVFRIFRGFGPFERLRHAITPSLSWSYSPAASVSDEFLAATNQTPVGYLGALAQNRLNLGLSTNIEARMRSRSDSSGTAEDDTNAPKIKLVTLQFGALAWDFERARATGKSGFATDRWNYTFRSDLLPGFDLGVDYSLFQGSILSDTAVFDPYREAVRASFSLDANSAIVRGIARLFGVESAKPQQGTSRGPSELNSGMVSTMGPQQGLGALTGTRARGMVTEIPTGQGFTASFNVSASRQRPVVGGRQQDVDVESACGQFLEGTFARQECERQAGLNSSGGDQNNGVPGGTFTRIPPQTSVGFRTSFNLTPKWAASWNTMYDVERSEFSMQAVTLQRELHDWKAIFGFTQAPNGNFAFTFFISLKAQPEIKVDYDRATYRSPNSARSP